MNREWIGISDMMSGLMLVFLFIAISFMVKIEGEKQKMKDVAISYRDTKVNLNEALYDEFEDDLKKWDASITTENSFVFNAPEVLFKVNKSDITSEFKTILEEFFSRYIVILTKPEYKESIKELRVEGHTSKSWKGTTSQKEIYLKNMKLSQERAYSVLSYCYSLKNENVLKQREWLEQHFRANGMAYAQLKDPDKARRVEFRVELKSERKVYEILQE